MKKGIEIPRGEQVESPREGEKKEEKQNLQPSDETIKKYEERTEKAKEARLRGDLVARVEGFKEEFKGIGVEIAGETYILDFTSLLKDGKRVEKVDDLKKEVEQKNLGLDRISGQFNLVETAGRPEKLNLTYTLPVKKILTCETPAALKRLITETFGGTDEYYKKLKAGTPKEKPLQKTAAGHGEKKEAKMDEIKKAAAAARADIAILEGRNFTSIIVRLSAGKQLHLTTADMAVWSVGEVDNGKMSGERTTRNPIEFIRPSEKEPGQ